MTATRGVRGGGDITHKRKLVIGDTVTDADPTRERHEHDAYQTDPRLAHAFVTQCIHDRPEAILDAGGGIGVFPRFLRQKFPTDKKKGSLFIEGVDITPNLMPAWAYDARHVEDFLTCNPSRDPAKGGPGYDVIGFNFPYGNEEYRDLNTEFLFRAYELLPRHGTGAIYALVRLNWLASQTRYEKIFAGRNNPAGRIWIPQLYVSSTRPTFGYPLPDTDGVAGGTFDMTYKGKTYPTDYGIVKFTFNNRYPVNADVPKFFTFTKKKLEDLNRYLDIYAPRPGVEILHLQ